MLLYTAQSEEGCRGSKPAALSERNRQAEHRESQGVLAQLCEFPGSLSLPGVGSAHKKRSPVSRAALIAKVSQSAAAVVFHPPLAVGRCPVARFCRPLAYKVRGHDIHEPTSGLLLCKCRRKYRRLAHTPGHLTQRIAPLASGIIISVSPRPCQRFFSHFHQRNLPLFGEYPWVLACSS